MKDFCAVDTTKHSEFVGKPVNKHTATCATIQRPVKGLAVVRVVPWPILHIVLIFIPGRDSYI